MADTLNPETLKTLRERRRWTQAQLAEKSVCSKEQIGRWERGETTALRKTSQERLCKALDVELEELTRPVDDSAKNLWNLTTEQLNVRVPRSTRTALELVSVIYGVSWADIIWFSPILFFISAQKSLEARKEALGDAFERAENITVAPHLVEAFSVFQDERAIQREKDSIENREVFAYGGSGVAGRLSPYAKYLKDSIDGLPEKERSWISEIESAYSEIPHYSFANDLLREFSGISSEIEDSDYLLYAIDNGDIDLKDLRRRRKSMLVGEFEKYLQEQIDEEKQRWPDTEELEVK